jgi:hypothetical protein
MPVDRRLTSYERQLRRAGLPLLIEGYSATEDIFTRALPLLTVVALGEILGAVSARWSTATNIVAFLGGALFLTASFGVVNRLRGRPFLSLPRRVGVPELAAFVLLPAMLPLVFGGQAGSAVLTALGNLLLVGLVWLVIGFGLLSILRWAGARLFSQLAASFTLLVRALPLILFFGLVAFFTAELWQLFNTVPTARYVAAVVLFIVIGLVFLSVQLSDGVDDVERAVDLAGTPLRRSQRINLALVILISQSLQILLVTALVWLFFAVFGALLVDVSVVEAWTGEPADTVITIGFVGQRSDDIIVTRQLLRAAFGIAAFSGLYYTVTMLVDAASRERFMRELTNEMHPTFAIRTEYLELRRSENGEESAAASPGTSTAASLPGP